MKLLKWLFEKLLKCKLHREEKKDFEKASYLPHIKFTDTVKKAYKNRKKKE